MKGNDIVFVLKRTYDYQLQNILIHILYTKSICGWKPYHWKNKFAEENPALAIKFVNFAQIIAHIGGIFTGVWRIALAFFVLVNISTRTRVLHIDLFARYNSLHNWYLHLRSNRHILSCPLTQWEYCQEQFSAREESIMSTMQYFNFDTTVFK